MIISAQARFLADKLLLDSYGAKAHMRDFKILQVKSDLPATIEYDQIVKQGDGASCRFVCPNTEFEYIVYLLKK